MLTDEKGLVLHQVGYSRKAEGGTAHPILQNVTAHFHRGKIAQIEGTVGAGKSTLLHLASGLMRPHEGEIRADGTPVSRYPAAYRDAWRREVGIVFQHLRLLGNLSVRENAELPLLPRREVSTDERANRALELLKRLRIDHAAERPLRTLSGGERQRVAVARALIGRPVWIVADEPWSHQDAEGRSSIAALLREAADNGAAVIAAVHGDDADIATVADERLLLLDGQLVPADIPAKHS